MALSNLHLLKMNQNIFYHIFHSYNTLYLYISLNLHLFLFTDFKFIYRDLNFTDLHSIFYFKNEIRFIGGMWDNLF